MRSLPSCLLSFLLIASLLQIDLVYAQGSLEILVVDQAKQPVAKQVIEISNNEIGFNKQAETNMNGKVLLPSLSTAGNYDVYVTSYSKSEIEGIIYSPQERTDVHLVHGKTAYLRFILQEKKVELDEVVISVKEYQAINSTDAEVSSDLVREEVEALPIEGRDLSQALYYLPNVTRATGFYPESPGVSINGANALYTNYQIDGLDNNEGFLGGQRFSVPIGITQTVTALTNNFSVEYGLTANGIINVTSKSGTNETKGSAFYVVRPGSIIDSSSPYPQRDLSGNLVKDGFQRHLIGAEIGGAIKKDKTFFHLDIEHTTDIKDNVLNVPQLGLAETITGVNNFTYVSAKITQYWKSFWYTTARINTGFIGIDRQGGGVEGGTIFPSAGNTQIRNSLNISFKNNIQRNNVIYETNYQYARFHWNYAQATNPNSPSATVLDPQESTIASIGNPGYIFNETENAHLFQQKIRFPTLGRHHVKAGVQVKASFFELFAGGNPDGDYRVKLSENQLSNLRNRNLGTNLSLADLPSDSEVLRYQIELRPQALTGTQIISSFYIEDYWEINPFLNFTFGLRYDYDTLSKGAANAGDVDNIAPRFSINYQITKKTSLRVGFGVFYDKIIYAVHSDALQFNSTSAGFKAQVQTLIDQGSLPANTNIDAVTREGTLSATQEGINYLQGASASDLGSQRDNIFQNELRIINPNGYGNPFSRQWVVGIQQKISNHTLLYADFIYNESYDLFRLRNLNAPTPYPVNDEQTPARTLAEADATRPIPILTDDQGQYAMINGEKQRGVARNILVTESGGRSRYAAMNITLQKRKGSNKYAYRLLYTLSSLMNDTEDINFRAMDANNFGAEWAPSINDRTHLINGVFTYYILKNLGLTLTGIFQSGQPINRVPDASIFGTSDLNGDGRTVSNNYTGDSDRQPGESRNSGRLPWASTFNLKFSYSLGFRNKSKIQADIQVFNLLNTSNLTGYASNITQSNQIQIGAASRPLVVRNTAPPRQFQLSLTYHF